MNEQNQFYKRNHKLISADFIANIKELVVFSQKIPIKIQQSSEVRRKVQKSQDIKLNCQENLIFS